VKLKTLEDILNNSKRIRFPITTESRIKMKEKCEELRNDDGAVVLVNQLREEVKKWIKKWIREEKQRKQKEKIKLNDLGVDRVKA